MRFKPTIFVQIWLPFTAMVLLILGVMAFYYPQRQRSILSGYKKEELQQAARMVAIGVQLSIDHDDFPGLQRTMNAIRENQKLDFISVVDSDSISGDVVFETIPGDFRLQPNEIDTIQYLFVKAPFESTIFRGYVVMGISKSSVFKDIDALNRPMMVFLLFIAVLTILVVYVIADRITSPISKVQKWAEQLQKGEYTIKDDQSSRAIEMIMLNDSLKQLANTLQEQHEDNLVLRGGLEDKIKERTIELNQALFDLNEAQGISKLGSFEYHLNQDHWEGSDNLFRILGINQHYPKTYASFFEMVYPEDAKVVQMYFDEGARVGNELNFECRLIQPESKNIIWVECRARYFQDENHQNVKMAGVIQDITERKKVDEELQILSLVAKKTSNAVIITNVRKEIEWVNESVVEITGYTREEIIGKTPKMFQFEGTDKNEIRKINAAIDSQQPVWAELQNKSKSGQVYWLSINIVPLKDDKGNLKGFMAVESDISERKKLEAQREEYVQLLEASKKQIEKINEELEEKVIEKTKDIAHLALFPEQNPNPVLEFDLEKESLNYSNPAAKVILKDFIELPFGQKLEMLQVKSMESIEQANKGEFQLDDHIFEVNLFLLEERRILRCYLHNITERKEQEAELSNLVKQLTAAESELTSKKEELERSLEELKMAQSEIVSKERLSTLGMLIAGIAHEINTPLGAIKASGENLKYLFTEGVMRYIGNMNPEELSLSIKLYERSSMQTLSTVEERAKTQLLLSQMNELDLPPRFKQKLARMLVQKGIFELDEELKSWMHLENAEQIFQLGLNFVLILRSIITTTASSDQGGKVVRALNSFAHGNVGSEFTQFSLKENIDTVITILWNKIKQGSRVINAIPEDLTLIGLADEISQVWTNLMNNALQASGNKCLITFEYSETDTHHVVTVSNDGPPIPDEIVTKIFDPFFTTKARGEGTGLGLNIVKKIIEKHKGSITCKSETCLTQFVVSLPKS